MTVIVDYDTGNLRSVVNALNRLGADHIVSADSQVIKKADHVLLPGVGEASTAMEKLRARRLDTIIPSLTQPVLGICIGMQLMCRSSEEGNATCMGIFPTDTVKLQVQPGSWLKIPHMGWDTVTDTASPLFFGIPDGSFFYYVHSYAPQICDATAGITDYGQPFSAALRVGNFFGVQFHPEKSGSTGAKLLSNFLNL